VGEILQEPFSTHHRATDGKQATELHAEPRLPPQSDAGGTRMDRDQELDDSLISGEHAGLEIAFDPCPGVRVCAGLQFMQPVFGMQPSFVHHLEDIPPRGFIIF
jgi:hypothetical protein